MHVVYSAPVLGTSFLHYLGKLEISCCAEPDSWPKSVWFTLGRDLVR